MKVVAAVLALLPAACGYGRASPETCHAKHIRDGKGGPGAYERCMETAEREERIREERRAGLRPTRGQRTAAIIGAIAGAQTAAPYWVCTDGWVSGCRADLAPHNGCCSWHGGMTNQYVYVSR